MFPRLAKNNPSHNSSAAPTLAPSPLAMSVPDGGGLGNHLSRPLERLVWAWREVPMMCFKLHTRRGSLSAWMVAVGQKTLAAGCWHVGTTCQPLAVGYRSLLGDYYPGVAVGFCLWTVSCWCGVVWCSAVWCGVVWCGVPKALLSQGKGRDVLLTGIAKRAGGVCLGTRFVTHLCGGRVRHSVGGLSSTRSRVPPATVPVCASAVPVWPTPWCLRGLLGR